MAVLGALGDLVLALSADTAKFQSDLGKADRIAGKFSRDVGRSLGVLTGAFLALGGATGILVRSQINAADEAGKTAQKIGMSVESLSAYMVAGELANISNEQLSTGFKQLAKNQADFVNGTGEAGDAFRALGISQEQIKALNGDNAALFDLVAGKLAGFADGANKTAIAMKIFGKSGAELIPLINELEKTRKEAEMLGAVIDKDTAAAAEKFNDDLARVGISIRAVGLSIAKELLPVMGQLAQEAAAAAKGTKDLSLAGDFTRVVFQTLAILGANVSFVLKGIGRDLGGMAAQLVALANLDFAGFTAIGDALKEDAARARAELDAFEERIMNMGTGVEAKAPEIAKKLAAPALIAADQIKKAMAEAEKAAEDALRLEEMAAEDRLGASEALKNQDIKNEQERQEALKQTIDAQVQSAEIATQLAEDMIYTWDQAGNRIEMTREQFEELESQQKKNTEWAREMGLTFTSAFEDAIVQGKGFRDILKGIEQDIARLIVRKSITEPVGSAITGAIASSGIGSFFGNLFGGTSVPNSGMAFAEGTDFVPRTGLALVHKGEKIIPADENRAGGVTIIQNISVDSRSDRAVIELAMRRAKDEAVAEVRAIQNKHGESRL